MEGKEVYVQPEGTVLCPVVVEEEIAEEVRMGMMRKPVWIFLGWLSGVLPLYAEVLPKNLEMRTTGFDVGLVLSDPLKESKRVWQPGAPMLRLAVTHFLSEKVSAGLGVDMRHFHGKEGVSASFHGITFTQKSDYSERVYGPLHASLGFEWGFLYPSLGGREMTKRDKRYETELSVGGRAGLEWRAFEWRYRFEFTRWQGTKSSQYSGKTFALLVGYSV